MNSPTDPYASSASSAGDPAQSGADQVLQQTTQQALGLITDSLNAAKDQACKVWDDMRPQLDKVASYAKEEPTKSVLMAAVAGALIVTVVMASNRSKRAVDVEGSKKWLRALAADAADRAKAKAEDARAAAESAQEPARRTLREYASTAADEAKAMRDSAVESAKRAAAQAYDGASERLQDLRSKADPLLDQIQPQLDSVAGYAKKNPLSALIVATAAGALLSRLAK
jgi:ElaB/YqjD/DUF883 family membrane-anchored ribosome-binding protein